MSHVISNHWQLNCLFNRLFRHTIKKTSKLNISGPLSGNLPITSGFPSQRAKNAEHVSMSWHRHLMSLFPPAIPHTNIVANALHFTSGLRYYLIQYISFIDKCKNLHHYIDHNRPIHPFTDYMPEAKWNIWQHLQHHAIETILTLAPFALSNWKVKTVDAGNLIPSNRVDEFMNWYKHVLKD